ncbi:unnamed protein product, partial [marine sediment metagenome]
MVLDIDYLLEVAWREIIPPPVYPSLGDSAESLLFTVFADDTKGACKFTSTVDGDVVALEVYCANVEFYVKLMGVIYEDNAGAPGDLIAVGTENATSDKDPHWLTLPFSAPVELTAGTYWIGFITEIWGSMRAYYNAGGANQTARVVNVYEDGPSDPFGVPDSYDNFSLNIYAVFEESEDMSPAKGYLFDPDDNLTGEVMSIEAFRGRDVSFAPDRWEPGQLRAILRNDDGKYSPNNAGSPLFGYLKAKRPIVLSAGLRESSLAAKFVAGDTHYLSSADNAALSVGDIYWDAV